MIDITDAPVRLRHLWAACCEIWPDLPPTAKLYGRASTDTDKRAAFCLAAKPFGHSQAQIAKFIKRERSTIANAQAVAIERRRRDSDYGVAIINMQERAKALAAEEYAVTPSQWIVPQKPEPKKPDADLVWGAERTMMEGSFRLLKAIVRDHGYAFENAGEVANKFRQAERSVSFVGDQHDSNIAA